MDCNSTCEYNGQCSPNMGGGGGGGLGEVVAWRGWVAWRVGGLERGGLEGGGLEGGGLEGGGLEGGGLEGGGLEGESTK